jgi:hypothetical protein
LKRKIVAKKKEALETLDVEKKKLKIGNLTTYGRSIR